MKMQNNDKVRFLWMGEEKVGKIDSINEENSTCNILAVDEYDGDYNLHMFVPLSNVRMVTPKVS